MGLANFPYISEIIKERKQLSDLYDSLLAGAGLRPKPVKDLEYNYGYYPIVFNNERELQNVFSALAEYEIYPRRYFYPSLNTLPYIERQQCPISEDISLRIACLPLFFGLESKTVEIIADIIRQADNEK
jgi:dTDP-4-amino-4,6-dideoxygalactose transaminase